MKIIISYPPLNSQNGCPTLGQNRQFQYFKEPTFIYPVVPAQAATLLKQAGHEVIWIDCLAEGIFYERFIEIIQSEKPDLIAFETKTPVIKQHWKIINDLKNRKIGTQKNRDTSPFFQYEKRGCVPIFPYFSGPLTVLFGDHVTALPEESFQNSKVDFVLTGGDYDFLLLNLCNALETARLSSLDCCLSSLLEPGIYYRENGQIRNTGKFRLNHDLNALPFIDRDLTKWQLYASKNGNYKRTPGTYIMAGRDCWYGLCAFCSWPALYPKFRKRSPQNVLNEISFLIERYNIVEIMDDTGCFPTGDWLRDFCKDAVNREIHQKTYLNCNMRFGALTYEDFLLMKKANFRLLLFGLESANQTTLDRIKKNVKIENVIEDCKLATKAGLFPHITIMFGYPWEDYRDALNTLKLGRWLLTKGYAYTMQATIVIPYPGAPLFKECHDNNLLRTLDWDDYDMKQTVMKIPIRDEDIMKLVRGMYSVLLNPSFILKKMLSINDIDDVKYFLRAVKKVAGHIFDFKNAASMKTGEQEI